MVELSLTSTTSEIPRFSSLRVLFTRHETTGERFEKQYQRLTGIFGQLERRANELLSELTEWAEAHAAGTSAELQAWCAASQIMLQERLQLLNKVDSLLDALWESDKQETTRDAMGRLLVELALAERERDAAEIA